MPKPKHDRTDMDLPKPKHSRLDCVDLYSKTKQSTEAPEMGKYLQIIYISRGG